MSERRLESWGWTPEREQALRERDTAGRTPGRITAIFQGIQRAITAAGEVQARVAGRLRHRASGRGDLPAVGDWVLLEGAAGDGDARIVEILPRRSRFSRKAAGDRADEQVVAANVDVVWIVAALGRELNVRRIERYLTLAWESGARPVVVLNKRDRVARDEVAAALQRVAEASTGVDVHAVSAATGEGLGELDAYLEPATTVALLGSSGVGKSTLINRLAGEEIHRVAEVREADEKGRHTTTHRELIRLPCGSLVIDTPGMREIQLWDADAGIEATFPDLERLALRCRFNDCRHEGEPGCALRQAVEDGEIAGDRLESYLKLQRELAHLERKKDARARREHRQRERRVHREHRKRTKKHD